VILVFFPNQTILPPALSPYDMHLLHADF
jgi:hypothetical protein